MKVFYMSDLHLEFHKNSSYVNKKIKSIKSNRFKDILVLNGDIIYFVDKAIKHKTLLKLSKKFKSVYIIAGNHELYYDSAHHVFYNFEYKNIKIVNNYNLKIGKYNLLFTSLFSHIRTENEFWVARQMNDFKVIEDLNPTMYNQIHDWCLRWLKNMVGRINDNIIVFTHHAPSGALMDEMYRGQALNDCFYAEEYEFIHDNPKIKMWIYGHTHDNKIDKFNQTKILSNQLGYYHSFNEDFSFNKYIEL